MKEKGSETWSTSPLSPELVEKEPWFFDKDFLSQVQQKKDIDLAEDETLQEELATYAELGDIDEELAYFIRYFADPIAEEDIDKDYLFQMGNALLKYEEILIEKVNKHAQTFGYHQMDLLDQALFQLGYLEYHLLKTPKEVILNEMVELAKRYSDQGAPRLVNGVMNAILSEEEGESKPSKANQEENI